MLLVVVGGLVAGAVVGLLVQMTGQVLAAAVKQPWFAMAWVERGFEALAVGGLGAGFLLVARAVLNRPGRSFMTTAGRFRGRRLLFGLLAMAAVCSLLAVIRTWIEPLGIDSIDPWLPTIGVAWGPFLLNWITLAVGLLIAAWSEEVIFRGWMVQQMGVITRSLPLILGLQAVLFAFAHLPEDAGGFVVRLATGLAYGWAALRLGGIEFGLGAHLANNLVLAWHSGRGWADPDPHPLLISLELVQTVAFLILTEFLARRPRSTAKAAPAPSASAAPPAGRP